MRERTLRSAALAAAWATTLVLPVGEAVSQGKAGTGALPDVVGFRPGLTLQDAYRQLQDYGIRGQVRAGLIAIPEIGDKPLPHTLQLSEAGPTSPEVLQLDVTLPPEKQVVWKVNRVLQSAGAAEPMAMSTVLGALREKYGKEYSLSPSSNTHFWFFDEQGKRAAEAGGVSYKECVAALGGEFQAEIANDVNLLPKNPYTDPQFDAVPPRQRPCRSLVVVIAHVFAVPGSDLVNALRVSVAHAGLATRARQATYEAIAAVQGKQQQETLDQAQQRKPKL